MIRCQNVNKRFLSKHALKDVDLQIKENTIVGLVGSNGAGKTTLLKIIAGCWRPTSGEVTVLNEKPFDNLFVATNSIFIDDTMVFPEVLTLTEIIESCALFFPNWDGELAKRLFTYFQFNEDAFYYELSKGRKSTFNALIGLAAHVPLTIFDEPTTGMDQTTRHDFYRALLKDYLANPRTIIISSHHLEEIEHLIEELIVIDEGKLFLHLPIDDVREYAIRVQGDKESVENFVRGRNVIHEEEVGLNNYQVVVEKEKNIALAEQIGLKISPVSASEVTVYLTRKKKGVIDDVFRTTS